MAYKHTYSPDVSDSTGLLYLAQAPARIALDSPLLASEIRLPPHSLIHCWIYKSLNSSESLQHLETARRKLVQEHKSLPVTQALLPHVRVAPDPDSSALYVFTIGSSDASSQSRECLTPGEFECLTCLETIHFSPQGLYPCSMACSTVLDPCATCLQAPMDCHSTSPWSSACLLPRIPLRRPYAEFIHAIQDRLIEDITQASTRSLSIGSRQAVRYKRGFLLGHPQATSAEWGIGWDHHARQRSLVHCELKLHLYPTRILIHPVLHSAHFLPLQTASSSSILAGDPITLLPHGVPAYYLNTYTGPVGNLTSQFDAAFIGLGVGDWKASSVCLSTSKRTTNAQHSLGTPTGPSFVIAWLAVQNRHGEDKGMPIIWPLSLCVAPSSASHPRPPLSFLPIVPAQLLASPPVPTAKAPSLKLPSSMLAPHFILKESNTPSPTAVNPRSSFSAIDSERAASLPQESTTTLQNPRPLRSSLFRSPTSDSLRAFRSLSITHKHSKGVASEVSNYVDAVAREREKERERLKREREGGNVSRSSFGTIKSSTKTATMRTASFPHNKPPVGSVPPGQEVDNMIDFTATPTQQTHHAPASAPAAVIPKADPAEAPFSPNGLLSAAEAASSIPAEASVPAVKSEPASHSNIMETSSTSFDPFPGFDSSWNQSSNDFIGMSLGSYDLGMSFSMGMNGAGDGGDRGGGFDMDDGFGVFTDDDFNFFDAPVSTAKVTTSSMLTPTAGPAPLNTSVSDNIQTSGPGPPTAASQGHPISWFNHALGEGTTPLSLGASTPAVPAPELVPTTPTQTPPSHSTPVTPSVMLADQFQSVHIRRNSFSSTASSNFDPIPFAKSHKISDGKYALGKFALPTPPPEDVPLPSFSHSSGFSWHLSYRTATDPRIGIMRRLAGAKRKRPDVEHDEREERRSPLWLRQHEEWISELVPEEPESDEDGKSDSELDEDDAIHASRSQSVSRAHTPPPSYLPLGPTLLQTQFQHGHLLPLCAPLRPPGTDLEVALGPAASLISAPTPVSPAAGLGAPAERSKALEGAAQILIKEVVENSVWGDCWQACLHAAQGSCKNADDVWMSDVRAASQLLEAVNGIEPPLNVGKTFFADHLQELSSPSLTVAKSDGIIQVTPPALRFWEKLGLHPRAGSKDLTVFAFFEGNDDETEAQVADWLERFSAVYMSKNFGAHVLGRTATCTRDGLVPVTFDAFRKTLVSFVASLPEFDTPMVFYIITPTRMMNLASPPLRQVFSAMKKVKKTYPDAPILMQLLPGSLIQGALHNPALHHAGLEILADTVYDRTMLPTDRSMSRALLPAGDKIRALFSEPAFTLPHTRRKVSYSLEAHPSTLDVLDRHYMLHIGYRASECGKWLFAACIDERGDAHDLRAWLMPDDDPDQFVVNSVWEFAMSIATRAHVEWRIVVSKLGTIGVAESHAWMSRLDAASLENRHLPPARILLLTAEYEDPWHFIASERLSVQKPASSANRIHKHPTGLVFADNSSAFFTVQATASRMTSISARSSSDLSFIPDNEEDKLVDDLQIRCLHSTTLIRAPADTDHVHISMLHLNLLQSTQSAHSSDNIADKDALDEVTRNYHELAVLTRCRWKLNANPILPFHLAALEVIGSALSRSDVVTD